MKNNDFNFNPFEFEKLHNIAKDLTNILLTKAEELPIPEILAKICVSPPYFAFKKIYKYDNVLIAPVEAEQPINFESTPISSAEASRHLAILGSCALAINENEHKYYLAVKARKNIGDAVKKKYFFVAIVNFTY